MACSACWEMHFTDKVRFFLFFSFIFPRSSNSLLCVFFANTFLYLPCHDKSVLCVQFHTTHFSLIHASWQISGFVRMVEHFLHSHEWFIGFPSVYSSSASNLSIVSICSWVWRKFRKPFSNAAMYMWKCWPSLCPFAMNYFLLLKAQRGGFKLCLKTGFCTKSIG